MSVGESVREYRKPAALTIAVLSGIGALGIMSGLPQAEGRAIAGPIYQDNGLPINACFWTPGNPQKGVVQKNGAIELMVDGRCTNTYDGTTHAYLEPDGNPDNAVWGADGKRVRIEAGTKIGFYCFEYGKIMGDGERGRTDRWALGEIPLGDHQSLRAWVSMEDIGYARSHNTPETPDLTVDILRKCE